MKRFRIASGGLAALLFASVAAIARGQNRAEAALSNHPERENSYRVTLLVSNEADEAPVTDPLLVNAWGLASSDTGPWWVADNGSGFATVYTGDGARVDLEVQTQDAPTGASRSSSRTRRRTGSTTFPASGTASFASSTRTEISSRGSRRTRS